MIKRLLVLLFCSCAFVTFAADPVPTSKAADQLISAATNSDFAYNRLALLCDKFGPRFSGTTNLEAAIDWVLAEMKKDGLENVHGEEAMIPHWVRGKESVELLSPRPQKLAMLGLGGSIATPPEGITAEVLVVKSFADLSNHLAEAKGKIVLFNEPFKTYHETVLIRTRGAIHAAQAGAVASLVRSVASFSMNTPHTGNMRYSDSVPKIPHAAITVEAADMLQRMQERGEKIVVRLKMEAKTLPDVKSRNVIGEIVGREKPEEVVIVSGHIDSWDVGQGAMDDGGGCLSAWEAVRLMHKQGLRPRRTIRVVLWTNEENGIAGGKAYRKAHEKELADHVLAIECDDGVFRPTSFAFTGSDAARKQIEEAAKLFQKVTPMTIKSGSGGADISQLEDDGVPLMDLLVDSTKYFWFHHSDADTIDVINRDELNQCVAAMAVMSYAIADAPGKLPR
jgi:carboxypeptidase Q